jgi:hypothetical protein
MENTQPTMTIKEQIDALTSSQGQRATEVKRLNDVEQELIAKRTHLKEQMTFTAGQIDALKSVMPPEVEPEPLPEIEED